VIGHLGEELSVYLDGELSQFEARKVTSHLAGCDHCRDYLGELIDIRARLRSVPMMDYVWQPKEAAPIIPIRRRPRVLVGAAAAVATIIVAVATLSAPRGVVALNSGDFAVSYNARRSLDTNFSGRVIPPDILSEDAGEAG
jgi:anti-sigma factor RsiW